MVASLRFTHGNLPIPLTSIIGREHEIDQLRSLSAGARLLTLVGTAGVGKTRLAIASSADIGTRHPGGVWFVDLATLSEGSQVSHAVAATLGITEHGKRSILDSLVEGLRESDLLLVLDNCEHLVEDSARLAEILLHSSEGLRVLATSRQPLGVDGEVIFTVHPLPLPDPSWTDSRRIASSPAVRMFVSRAVLRQPDFQLGASNAAAVAGICLRLDGIPLAIELSAAHIRHMPADQILLRLERRFELLAGSRTAPERHRTLRAALDWSSSLLTDTEHALFCHLSVFGGSFDAEAVAAVCQADLLSADPITALSALVDKSLLTTVEPIEGRARFRLLETLREYARERAIERGDWDEYRERHAGHFLAVAEEAAALLERDDQVRPLDRLTADYDNMRRALEWSRLNSAELLPTLAAALGWFWYHRSHHEEGRIWLAVALEIETGRTPVRALLLRQAGLLAYRKGDVDHARQMLEEAIALEREIGDPIRLALALGMLAYVLLGDEDLAPAEYMLQQELAIAEEVGNQRLVADALNLLIQLACQRGDLARARAYADRAIEIARQTKRMSALGNVLLNSAMVRIQQDELAAAHRLLEESILIRNAFGDRMGLAIDLDWAAELAAREGRRDRAMRLSGAADARYEAVGDSPHLLTRASRKRWQPAAQRRLGPRASRLSDEGRRLSDEQAIAYMISDQNELGRESARAGELPLTQREHEVVKLLVAGLTNREIAGRLGISERTVDGHVEHIRNKLAVRSRVQIAAWAVGAGAQTRSPLADAPPTRP